MAEGIFLMRKLAQGNGKTVVNGVDAVVMNSDDANTLAQHNANAVAICNAAYPKDPGGSDPFPADYFDSATAITDLVAGPIQNDGAGYAFGLKEVRESGIV